MGFFNGTLCPSLKTAPCFSDLHIIYFIFLRKYSSLNGRIPSAQDRLFGDLHVAVRDGLFSPVEELDIQIQTTPM